MGKFDRKVAIITGASSGIGAATAIAFAKEGAKLAIIGRNKERLAKTAELCRSSSASEVLEIIADISKFDALKEIVDRVVAKYSDIHVLVNNAAFANVGEISELTHEVYASSFDTNVRAAVFLSQYALPHLKETKGSIVNVSSAYGIRGRPRFVTYGMTKAALDHFTKGFAAECAGFGVRINSINPGGVDTGLSLDQLPPGDLREKMIEGWDYVQKHQKLGILQPETVATSILFLCESSHVTGTLLLVDGGLLLPV